MPFDYQAARSAGASDDEILNHLTQTRHFDVAGALQAGASKSDIIQHLSTTSAPQWISSSTKTTQSSGPDMESVVNKYKQKYDEIKKAYDVGQYVAGFATGGPIGLAQAYMGAHPKETVETALGAVKNIAKAGTQITVQNPLVAEAAGLIGGEDARNAVMQPRDIPLLGNVQPLSAVPDDVTNNGAQTPAQSAMEAGNIYLEGGMPGAGKVISKVASKIGPFSKWAELASNTPARVFDAAAQPEMAAKIKAVRDAGVAESPQGTLDVAEAAFQKANAERKKAMQLYAQRRDAIISSKEGKIIQRSRDFVDGVMDTLNENKIRVGPKGVNLVGSQLEGSASAKEYLDRAYHIMTRPIAQGAEAVDDLLTRREALSNILTETPVGEKNLRRILTGMRGSFDSTLEDVLGKSATVLRTRYAKSMQPTSNLISAMTKTENGVRTFSPNRALSFMRKAATDAGFDQRQMLAELDGVVGTDFEKTAEAMGIEKAISRLDPPTAGRAFDIVKSFISKGSLGSLAPMFSPKFWGEVALTKGLKAGETAKMTKSAVEAAKRANEFKTFVLTNLLTLPIRKGAEAVTNAMSPDAGTAQ